MGNPPENPTLKARASLLRRHMTKEEFKLWYHYLRTYPIKFRRQKILAPFICDFTCHQARLIIEIDGSQHYTEKGKAHDTWRTDKLQAQGYTILRFSNQDIHKNFYGVCLTIDRAVKEKLQKK